MKLTINTNDQTEEQKPKGGDSFLSTGDLSHHLGAMKEMRGTSLCRSTSVDSLPRFTQGFSDSSSSESCNPSLHRHTSSTFDNCIRDLVHGELFEMKKSLPVMDHLGKEANIQISHREARSCMWLLRKIKQKFSENCQVIALRGSVSEGDLSNRIENLELFSLVHGDEILREEFLGELCILGTETTGRSINIRQKQAGIDEVEDFLPKLKGCGCTVSVGDLLNKPLFWMHIGKGSLHKKGTELDFTKKIIDESVSERQTDEVICDLAKGEMDEVCKLSTRLLDEICIEIYSNTSTEQRSCFTSDSNHGNSSPSLLYEEVNKVQKDIYEVSNTLCEQYKDVQQISPLYMINQQMDDQIESNNYHKVESIEHFLERLRKDQKINEITTDDMKLLFQRCAIMVLQSWELEIRLKKAMEEKNILKERVYGLEDAIYEKEFAETNKEKEIMHVKERLANKEKELEILEERMEEDTAREEKTQRMLKERLSLTEKEKRVLDDKLFQIQKQSEKDKTERFFYQEECEVLKKELKRKEGKIKFLNTENEELNQIVASVKNELSQMTLLLHKKINENNANEEKLVKEKELLREKLQEVEYHLLNEIKESKESADSKVSFLEEKLNDANRQLNIASKLNENLEEELALHKNSFNSSNIVERKKTVALADEPRDHLQIKASVMSEVAQRYEEDVAERIMELEKKIEEKQTALLEVEANATRLKEMLVQNQRDNDETSKLERALAEKEVNMQKVVEEKNNISAKLIESEKQLAEKDVLIRRLDNTRVAAEEHAEDAKKQITLMQQMIEKNKKALADAQKDKEDILKEIKAERSATKHRLSALQKEFSGGEALLTDLINEKEEKLRNLAKENENLTLNLSFAENETQRLNTLLLKESRYREEKFEDLEKEKDTIRRKFLIIEAAMENDSYFMQMLANKEKRLEFAEREKNSLKRQVNDADTLRAKSHMVKVLSVKEKKLRISEKERSHFQKTMHQIKKVSEEKLSIAEQIIEEKEEYIISIKGKLTKLQEEKLTLKEKLADEHSRLLKVVEENESLLKEVSRAKDLERKVQFAERERDEAIQKLFAVEAAAESEMQMRLNQMLENIALQEKNVNGVKEGNEELDEDVEDCPETIILADMLKVLGEEEQALVENQRIRENGTMSTAIEKSEKINLVEEKNEMHLNAIQTENAEMKKSLERLEEKLKEEHSYLLKKMEENDILYEDAIQARLLERRLKSIEKGLEEIKTKLFAVEAAAQSHIYMQQILAEREKRLKFAENGREQLRKIINDAEDNTRMKTRLIKVPAEKEKRLSLSEKEVASLKKLISDLERAKEADTFFLRMLQEKQDIYVNNLKNTIEDLKGGWLVLAADLREKRSQLSKPPNENQVLNKEALRLNDLEEKLRCVEVERDEIKRKMNIMGVATQNDDHLIEMLSDRERRLEIVENEKEHLKMELSELKENVREQAWMKAFDEENEPLKLRNYSLSAEHDTCLLGKRYEDKNSISERQLREKVLALRDENTELKEDRVALEADLTEKRFRLSKCMKEKRKLFGEIEKLKEMISTLRNEMDIKLKCIVTQDVRDEHIQLSVPVSTKYQCDWFQKEERDKERTLIKIEQSDFKDTKCQAAVAGKELSLMSVMVKAIFNEFSKSIFEQKEAQNMYSSGKDQYMQKDDGMNKYEATDRVTEKRNCLEIRTTCVEENIVDRDAEICKVNRCEITKRIQGSNQLLGVNEVVLSFRSVFETCCIVNFLFEKARSLEALEQVEREVKTNIVQTGDLLESSAELRKIIGEEFQKCFKEFRKWLKEIENVRHSEKTTESKKILEEEENSMEVMKNRVTQLSLQLAETEEELAKKESIIKTLKERINSSRNCLIFPENCPEKSSEGKVLVKKNCRLRSTMKHEKAKKSHVMTESELVLMPKQKNLRSAFMKLEEIKSTSGNGESFVKCRPLEHQDGKSKNADLCMKILQDDESENAALDENSKRDNSEQQVAAQRLAEQSLELEKMRKERDFYRRKFEERILALNRAFGTVKRGLQAIDSLPCHDEVVQPLAQENTAEKIFRVAAEGQVTQKSDNSKSVIDGAQGNESVSANPDSCSLATSRRFYIWDFLFPKKQKATNFFA